MAVVYLWFGGDLKKGLEDNLESVGHASLQYGSKPTDYISFWPQVEKTESRSVISRFVSSYKQDCENEIEREADLNIPLNKINNVLVEAFWLQFKSTVAEKREFDILKKNCSTVVSEALTVGYRVKDKIGTSSLYNHIPYIDKMISGSNISGYLIDHFTRDIFNVRSSQEFLSKIDKGLVKIMPSFLRKQTIATYVRSHSSIIWTPFILAYFAHLLKEELD